MEKLNYKDMAKKIWDEKITKKTNWGGDGSTSNLPVSGRRVQEFIKDTFEGKHGYARVIDEKFLQFFADMESAVQYDEDPVANEALLLNTMQLPRTGVTVAIMRVTVLEAPGQYSAKGSTESFRFRYQSYYKNEQDQSTVRGQAIVKVNNVQVETLTLRSGNTYEIPLSKYFTEDLNYVEITVNNGEGSRRAYTYDVNIVDLRIVSTFDHVSPYPGAIDFRYTPYGDVLKTVHFLVDGRKIASIETTANNRQLTQTIPVQAHGAHSLEVYMTAEISGITIESSRLRYSFISIEEGNETPVISVSPVDPELEQYETLNIPHVVYDPLSTTSNVELLINGEVVSTRSVDRSEQSWSYRVNNKGEYSFTIRCREVEETLHFNVTASVVTSEAETQDLQLYLTSQGRSNQDTGKDIWESNGIQAQFSGMTWVDDGWVADADGHVCLRLVGNGEAIIPLNIFTGDLRATGKTIEIEFAARNVRNYAANLVTCYSGNRGIQITANTAMLKSEQSSIDTKFKEDERFRISFVIEKRTNNRLIQLYVNGVKSRSVQYPENDNFTQLNPVGITLGSTEAILDVYNIRVYNNNLNAQQLLDNYIADMDDIDRKIATFNRNQVYDTHGEINMTRLLEQLPVMTIVGELPQYKGDKKTVRVEYTDRKNPGKSFVAENCQLDVQGTSSQYYPRKNYKFKARDGFDMVQGGHADGFTLNEEECLPATVFCTKADFAESSGTHNTGMADYVGWMLREAGILTEPQEANPTIRTTVYGEPCVIFHKKDNGSIATFIGKYNFNTDKAAENTFGFAGGDESWEFLNNTSDIALFKTADFTRWRETLEARYPEDHENIDRVIQVFEWVVACKGDTEKFKEELEQYFDKRQLIFYYLITLVFGMVDQRAKNQFLTVFGQGGWLFIFYDNDTCLGINNEGAISFLYNIETRDVVGSLDVWNGANSELWKLVEDAFADDTRQMYHDLRQRGILSYDKVIEYTNTRQSDKWCEAVYNEDGYFKYEQPLVEGFEDWSSGSPVMTKTAAYLYALQGSRDAHRRWWLYNRFKYLDSKFQAGSSLSDFATFRTYTPETWGGVAPKADITLKTFNAMYATIKWGSVTKSERMGEGETKTITAPEGMTFNDTETIIYNASSIASLGDLSPLYLGSVDVSRMTNLTELIIGSSKSGYKNSNLRSLSLGTNNLLRKLYVYNCSEYAEPIGLANCKNIEEVDARGTKIPSVNLPASGNLKTMYLPNTISNLTVRNQPNLSTLSVAGYSNISTLYLDNVPKINTYTILKNCLNNGVLSRVRVTNINQASSGTIAELEKLALLGGIDDNGNNTEHAIIAGKYYINEIVNDAQLNRYKAMWPGLVITYKQLAYTVVFTDPEVQRLCLANWAPDGDGVLYSNQLAAVRRDDFLNVFRENSKITTFHEWKYFSFSSAINSGAAGVALPNLVAATITKYMMGQHYVLGDCPSLNDLKVINSLEDPTPVGYFSGGNEMFKNCGTLTPGGVINVKNTDRNSKNVYSGSKIREVIFLPGTTSLPDKFFAGCTGLEKISNFPDGLTHVGLYAFLDTKIDTYVLPASLTSYSGWCLPGTNVKEITGLEGNTAFVLENGVLYNLEMTEILDFPPMKTGEYTMPSTITRNVVKYSSGRYYALEFAALSKLTLQDPFVGISSLDESYVQKFLDAFTRNENLQEINITGEIPGETGRLKTHDGALYMYENNESTWLLCYVPPKKTGELEMMPGSDLLLDTVNKESMVTRVTNFRKTYSLSGYLRKQDYPNRVFRNVTEYVAAPEVEGEHYKIWNDGLFILRKESGSGNIYIVVYPPASSGGEVIVTPPVSSPADGCFGYSKARGIHFTAGEFTGFQSLGKYTFEHSLVEYIKLPAGSPPRAYTDTFTGALDTLKVLVPHDKLGSYHVSSNWKNITEKLVGYGQFEGGAALPEGYVWYSDMECTQVVTEITVAGEYYCKVQTNTRARGRAIPGGYYKASEGKVFRRIVDGEIFGDTLYLGYTYYIDGEVLAAPRWEVIEDYEEIDDPRHVQYAEIIEEDVKPVN